MDQIKKIISEKIEPLIKCKNLSLLQLFFIFRLLIASFLILITPFTPTINPMFIFLKMPAIFLSIPSNLNEKKEIIKQKYSKFTKNFIWIYALFWVIVYQFISPRYNLLSTTSLLFAVGSFFHSLVWTVFDSLEFDFDIEKFIENYFKIIESKLKIFGIKKQKQN
ncbi:hypothetical protein M0811_01576 [Anaeramoeba ignava]|uniref:Uncharacterized protein n=1 Tax=Anaeramoeba ignava TaxID=1746090 RepID=A0A9Q0LFY3_ANAIG|nr:hypothetical protein M0811_01576 [Anaeramoeba ignava]